MAFFQSNDAVIKNLLAFSTISLFRMLKNLRHLHIILVSVSLFTQYTLLSLMITVDAAMSVTQSPTNYATELRQDLSLLPDKDYGQHIQHNPEYRYSAQLHNSNSNHQHHYYHHSQRRLQRDSRTKDITKELNFNNCKDVEGYFDSIDIQLPDKFDEKDGSICKGQCCANSTEVELKKKATIEFVRLLHHHTKSLRGILESTAHTFESHILELMQQSENRTLNVFSQVYWRMEPLSRKLIIQLYTDIISHLKGAEYKNFNSLEESVHEFFVHLFPVAYHQAVHISKNNNGELHDDYKNCLEQTFDELLPFRNIPKELTRNLVQSVQTANIFMKTLKQSAEILTETDELYASHLSENCQRHLLKMSYCPGCNGLQKVHAKPCYSYCMNVLRGCSSQYAGVLDSPWSNVVDAIENLVTTNIRSDNGILAIIKQMDSKLSEAIMWAMENGSQLEHKVKKTCGTPKLLPSLTMKIEKKPITQHNIKWASPVDSEMLRLLSTIDKSKEFYSNIVNTVCDDDDIQKNDRHCWTGDRIGDYTQPIMTTSIDLQRYNPEVPLQPNSHPNKLNELVDKLLKIRKNIASAIQISPVGRNIDEIQNDMAGHDEEGSGHISDDVDDDDYNNLQESSGSGDGSTPPPFDIPVNRKEDIIENTINSSNSLKLVKVSINFTMTTITILVMHYITCRL